MSKKQPSLIGIAYGLRKMQMSLQESADRNLRAASSTGDAATLNRAVVYQEISNIMETWLKDELP